MKLKFTVLFVLLVVALSQPVLGAVVGISPSIARFSRMVKGGYAERNAVVSTSIVQPVNAHFIFEGDIKEWVTVEPGDNDFVFSKDEPYTFTMIIQPPEDTLNGNYSGILKVRTDNIASVEEGAGSSILAEIGMLIYVEVIGEQIVECRAGAISTSNAEINLPFTVNSIVYNDGNVRFRPEVIVEVWDQYRTQILLSETFLGPQILPTKNRQFSGQIKNSLPVGQYFADIYVRECDVRKTTTFDIVEKGGIADSGELMGIRTNDIGYVNEPMPVFPLFRNTGTRNVLSQFKGEIRDLGKDKVVQILESDSLEVSPQETVEFKMFFIPDKEGTYQVSG
ncbi:hypothetical protein JXC34_02955, partial [Candidatus Woesearchaeota archaeon]|nr:hypothetical protein [Candidatus Woesearchaeota archaeon]